ncbi:hypothetical protein SNE85_000807 [Vibrio cholerae]|nr:hypothetical protein [Vibrio cholerae]
MKNLNRNYSVTFNEAGNVKEKHFTLEDNELEILQMDVFSESIENNDWLAVANALESGEFLTENGIENQKAVESAHAYANHMLRKIEGIQMSDEVVGFTSAMKLGFVFSDDSQSRNYPNHVNTEFRASKEAVSLIENLKDSKVVTVKIAGEIVVVSLEEAKLANLGEVTLKVVNKNTDDAEWLEADLAEAIEKAKK